MSTSTSAVTNYRNLLYRSHEFALRRPKGSVWPFGAYRRGGTRGRA